MSELLAGVKLVLNDDSHVLAEEHLKGKMVALYFSAGWCPPCRAFTPKLKRLYEALIAAGKPFEVVWVSRDREEEDLIEYYKDHHGSWAYLPFGSNKIPYVGGTLGHVWNPDHLTSHSDFSELLEKYEVKTIPALKVIKADGTVVVRDARTEVAERGGDNPEVLYEEWESFC